MSPRNLQDVPLATWQWRDSLIRLILTAIIFTWGVLLEVCGEQPNYSPELQYLMSFGSFIVAIILGALAQATLAHMFSYVQGYFLLKSHGIPLHAIMSGEQTPGRILAACLTIFKYKKSGTEDYKEQKYGKFYQIFLYTSTLIVYFASVGVGGYAASELGTSYVYYSSPIKWVQVPTIPNDELRVSLNNAFLPKDFLSGISSIQYNSLARWVQKTAATNKEVAFLPITLNNIKDALDGSNLKDGLLKWKVEAKYDNVNMQYITAQCDVDPNPSCNTEQFIQEETIIYTKASKDNKTLLWDMCNLPGKTGSIRLVCSITLKGGVFPSTTIVYPENLPRGEQLAEILLRKDEMRDLNELRDEMFNIMEKVLARPTYNVNNDIISSNVLQQLLNQWNCEARNVTCAQELGTAAAIRYFGARLEAANIMYPVDNLINVNEWIEKSGSTGSLTVTHKVCIGGSNPILTIGLMIFIPSIMIVIELLPLLFSKNKAWWLASDIGFKHIALLRSTAKSGINLPECTDRPNEITNSHTAVRFNVKPENDYFGLEEV
ncbi:hypothetical protein RhiirA5_377715 [Rhizophagus irregularis]|uniref:Uncharacterized protein n=1 Tax=Rhizophagus irregularis TaxID=588596 RepID=A0A2I1E9R6_9GLOM|nr:hypothetical protein RhiirA5_377715 [Rhizophagus irregularis]PKY18833.1 hypothetical protein RhiirB3_383624 [Rhizophagus irregularis]CAB5365909.1 unnamed protein product [Rhizophagus irregularis]